MVDHVGFIGIAIATSMAAWVNAGLLWLRLRSLGHYTADARLIARLPKIILASALMGAALWAAATYAGPYAADLVSNGWTAEALGILALAALVVGGMGLYGVLCQLTGAATLSDIRQAVRR